jgi:DNA-binding LytR/AlgR family response regulator
MKNPTAILVEDEAVLRGELRDKLAHLWPELRVVGEADDGVDALRLLAEHSPDVMFLDVEMPRLNGLDVARQARGRCHVVFVTAYDAHAVAAFEHGALDYILKPIDLARLALTVRRVERRLGGTPQDLDDLLRQLATSRPRRTHLRWINASQGDLVRLITVDDVCYFQADTGYTNVVTNDSQVLIRRSLKDLEVELDPAIFWPIHRSTIVNANAIAGVVRDFRGRISVTLKSRAEKLPVSEAHVHLFRQM